MSGSYRLCEWIVRAWVSTYLVGMDGLTRKRRTTEIESDLYEQRRYVLERGRSESAAAVGLVMRCFIGAVDDLLWRSEQGARREAGMSGTVLKYVVRAAIGSAVFLLLPLAGELLMEDFNWGPGDFIGVGVAVFLVGVAFQLISGLMRDSLAYRAGVGIGLLGALLLFFIVPAVGAIGGEDNAANAMYLAVFAVGGVGALVARFRPTGMAITLFAAALVQATIGVIALVSVEMDPAWWGGENAVDNAITLSQIFRVTLGDPTPVQQILGINGMFTAMFVASALLFAAAAREGGHAAARRAMA
ncbi:MAG: hypothetical protein FJ319_03615 [SAR202 cluster bacterium]|nr:hypothetical protein [SAR202 cluster bacterium]